MFKNLKMTIATRRVQNKSRKVATRKNTRRTPAKKTQKLGARIWNIVCWPFRMIGRGAARLWAWIRSIDLIGLVNSTLLIAIICLFSMLIIDVLNCRRDAQRAANTQQEQVVAPVAKAERTVTVNAVITLPAKYDENRKIIGRPVNVARVKPDPVAVRQTAKKNNTMFGDVIIDSRGAATMLQNGTHVRGNLYLQNMRKYTLPCDVRIEGNLFLRDMGMLQFCGDFTVTGNIYVSPRSSFGPIPATARLGGQVIL